MGYLSKPLYLKDKILLLFFFPFLFWSFLGGHKQFLFGINTDHVATALAFIGSILVFLFTVKVSKKYLFVLFLFSIIILSYLVSIPNSGHGIESFSLAIKHIVYIFITLGLALLFQDRINLFFSLIILLSFISAFIILLSFSYLGLGSWLRMTVPVYENGQFLYFPRGYESSSDPNVLSYFLFLGALVLFYVKGLKGYWWIVFFTIFSAGVLTFSRSGFLAFTLVILLYFISQFIVSLSRMRVSKGFLIKEASMALMFIIFIFVLLSYYDFSYFLDIVEQRIYSIGSNNDRVVRILYTFNEFYNYDFYSLIFGKGMGATRLDVDPHSFWLSILLDTGLFSFIAVFFAFVFLFIQSFMGVKSFSLKLLIISLFLYFLIISLFYWQIRTFYFVMLIFIIFYISKESKGFRWQPSA